MSHNSTQRTVSALGLAVLLGLALGSLPSHAANLVIENAGIQVPLQSGTIVTFDIDGNVSAQCRSNGEGGCLGLPNPNGVSVTLGSNVTTIIRGGTIAMTWTPSAGAEVCLAFSSPALPAWDGPKSGTANTQNVVFATAGTYTLFMQCYDSEGSAGAVSRTITVI